MSEITGWNEALARTSPLYAARLEEEESKLRWLMSRHPGSRELSYYLIFLLAANNRYENGFEECRRVLEAHPHDLIARVWSERLRLRWSRCLRRRMSQRPFTGHGHRRIGFRYDR